jgi:drug/metabolite transporter (DMT)-like permease
LKSQIGLIDRLQKTPFMTNVQFNSTQRRTLSSGVMLIVLASLFWSLNGALIKIVNQDGQGPDGVAIAFYRSLIAGLFLLPLSLGKWKSPGPASRTGGQTTVHLLKTPAALWCLLFFTLMTVSFVVANTKTAPASVIILQYTSTFWIVGLSPLVLNERPHASDLWFLGMAFGGVVIIFVGEAFHADPKERANMLGLAFALASGLFYALLTLMLRKLRHADSAAVTVFNQLGSAMLLLPVVLLAGTLSVSTRKFLLLVLMGIVRGVRNGRRSVHKWESDTQYWAKLFKRKAPKTDFPPARCVPGAAPRRESLEGGEQEEDFALAKRTPICDSGAIKWVLYAVGYITLVIGVTFLIGYTLPARTTISRSITRK